MITKSDAEGIVARLNRDFAGEDGVAEVTPERIAEWAQGAGVETEVVMDFIVGAVGAVPGLVQGGLSPQDAVASLVTTAFITAWSLADSRVPDSAMPSLDNLTTDHE